MIITTPPVVSEEDLGQGHPRTKNAPLVENILLECERSSFEGVLGCTHISCAVLCREWI